MRKRIFADFTPLVVASLVLSVFTPRCGAQDERYREREVLDAESGQWVEAPVAEDADRVSALDEARRLLAEGRSREAYKRLKAWTQENPEHERYFEGVFLLGEAEFERRRFYQAFENYEYVIENTGGELFYKALRREMDVARAFLSGEKRVVWSFLRMPAYDDGIEILDRIWERVPGTRLGELAIKLKADHFFATGDIDLAQDEYVHLVREYPNGRYTQLAMLRAAEAAAAAFPGIKFDDRALLDAQVRYSQVQNAFPGYSEREGVSERLQGIREQRAEKDLDIARWYERTNQSESAEFYYRRVLEDWPDTLAAVEARSRLRDLGSEPSEEGPQP